MSQEQTAKPSPTPHVRTPPLRWNWVQEKVDLVGGFEIGELESLVAKLEILARIRELSEPRPAPKKTLWDRPILLGFLGTVIAAIVPAMTVITSHYEFQHRAELARAQFEHDRRLEELKLNSELSTTHIENYALREWMDRAADAKTPWETRTTSLRFLAAVAENRALKEWAIGEVKHLSDERNARSERLAQWKNAGLEVKEFASEELDLDSVLLDNKEFLQLIMKDALLEIQTAKGPVSPDRSRDRGHKDTP